MEVRVLYRVPEASVVQIFRQYAGDPFDSLIAPRVQEALKEVTAALTADLIVKRRDSVKTNAIAAARSKIGEILYVDDIVIRNIHLSKELETAIEAKMVAEQEAARARFTQVQTQVEAETAVIRAEGEAKAIRVRGRGAETQSGLSPAANRREMEREISARRAGGPEQLRAEPAPAAGRGRAGPPPMNPRLRAFLRAAVLLWWWSACS